MGDSKWVAHFLLIMKPRCSLSRHLLFLTIIFFVSACSYLATPTPFIPPTAPAQLIEPTLIIQPTANEIVRTTPLPTIPLPTVIATINLEACINNLTFVTDLTIPDGTFITYGATIDKQWAIQNSGTCNWDSGYSLRYIGGAQLGAPGSIALYPAKSGTQATIQITFTAPFTDGEYASAWQAFDPTGLAFGDAFFLRIVVGAP